VILGQRDSKALSFNNAIQAELFTLVGTVDPYDIAELLNDVSHNCGGFCIDDPFGTSRKPGLVIFLQINS